jgi:hypothetical protein
LSGVTLRQLHEIFDQLAKNHDPDVSRTLYTNLIIRPHPGRRLELLIDEAFNGKGLDEMMYCFQPAGGEPHNHDDNLEILEEAYESSDFEDTQSAEADDETNGPYQADDDHSDNEENLEAEDDDGLPEGEPADADADDADEDVEYYDNYADLDDTTTPPQPPNMQEADQGTVDGNEALDIVEVGNPELLDPTLPNGTEEHVPPTPDSLCYCDRCLFDDGTGPMDEESVVQADQASQALRNRDVTNPGALPDHAHDSHDLEQDLDEPSNLVDNAGFDLIEITDDEDVVDEAEVAERSATATLTGDGDNSVEVGEQEMNDILNADVPETESRGDPVNEIDWRDFAEDGEVSPKDMLSSSVKRPRPEGVEGEEDGEEGQNGKLSWSKPFPSSTNIVLGVKRRRSR